MLNTQILIRWTHHHRRLQRTKIRHETGISIPCSAAATENMLLSWPRSTFFTQSTQNARQIIYRESTLDFEPRQAKHNQKRRGRNQRFERQL